MPRLLVSAAHKSSGKTIISLGLCAALRQQGTLVQPFKKGPDFIDPMWLGQAAGRPCHNLDFHTQTPTAIRQDLAAWSHAADMALIEGTKGLFDDVDPAGQTSNAALARLTATPVVLVIDCEGMTRGIAPLLLGYRGFEPDTRIAGVILNKVGGQRHEGKLRRAVENYTDFPVFGAVQREPTLLLTERHLGLIPSNEDADANTRIAAIAAQVGAQVDLAGLQAAAAQAPALPMPVTPPLSHPPDLRIGILRDAAFGFYYPGDLQALEQAGARLVMINALRDTRLPAVDGLLIGGGFPETHMEALAANQGLKQAIYEAIEAGLPVYAECGGLMYLSRSIRWGERQAPMVGAIAADTVMDERPKGRGYVRLQETGASPWPALTADQAPFAAHEFHYSHLENITGEPQYAYRVLRGTGIEAGMDGLIYKNTLACYAHLRHVAATPWASRFVSFVRRFRRTENDHTNPVGSVSTDPHRRQAAVPMEQSSTVT